jgi:RNA polymerase sigma-70 factor (ECF subfamily)
VNQSIGVHRKDERKLIARALRGDSDALQTLVERNHKQVYALCLRMTRSVVDAEDLTQDAFVHVLSKLNTFRGKSKLSTWIYRIATNTALMHFRKKQRYHTFLDGPAEDSRERGSSDIALEVSQTDRQQKATINRLALTRALEQLPLGCRNILVMHDIEGYAHREIARFLRCATGTSKSQLHKARRKMRQALKPKPGRVASRMSTRSQPLSSQPGR